MTEEEYQAKILEHEQTILSLQEKITQHTTKETEYTTEKEKLNNDIAKLKEHNMSLFLKITQQEKTPENNKPIPEKTIDDITNKLLEKEI